MYSSFDESATFATLSSMSSSSEDDESSQDDSTDTRYSGRTQRQSKGKHNRNCNSNKGKGKRKGKTNCFPKRDSRLLTSTKPHDAPMKRRDLYFALDCEMVGVGPGGLDSALARVSIVNWDNEIVLDTYVKVHDPVTDYRTFVSGITPEQIESESAATLTEVRRKLTSILQGKILIGHGLSNDLKVMGINHPWCDIRDSATYVPFMRPQESRISGEQTTLCPRKLRDLVWEKLGNKIQVKGKPHSPVEDAIAAMSLYKSSRSEWETAMMKQVNQANQVSDEWLRRIPFIRRFPEKLSVADIASVPLFPKNQYYSPQMNYSPLSSYYNHNTQNRYYAAQQELTH